MADNVSPEVRSRMMAGIRGKNTKPEKFVRSGLHRLGFRFRLHDRRLPGKPDLVLRKWNAVIFVHGCFWHGHDCPLFKMPSSRTEFWRHKIKSNQKRDQATVVALLEDGWRVLVVWECAFKGRGALPAERLFQHIVRWLRSDRSALVIQGK